VRGTAVGALLVAVVGPVLTVGQEADSARVPLVITDRAAVEAWSRAIYDGELDPEWPSDTAFLLTLSETERLGRFRFRQRCALCHAYQADRAAETWGPVLTRAYVDGREAAVRQRILEGSAGMPSFRYALDAEAVEGILGLLKAWEGAPEGAGPTDGTGLVGGWLPGRVAPRRCSSSAVASSGR